MVTDAQGRKADFKNAIVVLTSNVGAARITAKGSKLGFSATERRDGETRPIEELKAAVLDDLKKVFRPEFLNRLDETIVFTQLGRTEIQAIARRMLERVGERMKALGVTLRFTDRALELSLIHISDDIGHWIHLQTLKLKSLYHNFLKMQC